MNALGADPNPRNPHFYLVLQCRALLNNPDWEIRIVHVYREANEAANWMANANFESVVEFNVFNAPSAGLSRILFADEVGYAQPRMIIN